jgi:hypothetical protein
MSLPAAVFVLSLTFTGIVYSSPHTFRVIEHPGPRCPRLRASTPHGAMLAACNQVEPRVPGAVTKGAAQPAPGRHGIPGTIRLPQHSGLQMHPPQSFSGKGAVGACREVFYAGPPVGIGESFIRGAILSKSRVAGIVPGIGGVPAAAASPNGNRQPLMSILTNSGSNLSQPARLHVVDEPPHRNVLGDPGM